MPVNPFFNFTDFKGEQDLVQDLIDESIQIYGHEAFYLKREDRAIDKLLGEDPRMAFAHAYPVELYLKSFDAFQGQSEFISKFGLQIEDQAMFLISARRFDQAIGYPASLVRPREGDMIFIELTPTNRYLFEIRFVENKEQLFQLGKLYTYELRCEMMNYSNEKVTTGIEEIDALALDKAYSLTLTVNAGGTGDYVVGETVTQTDGGKTTTALVRTWDSGTRELLVQQVEGVFVGGAPIVGAESLAKWIASNDVLPDDALTQFDPVSDNEYLQTHEPPVVVKRGTHILDE